MAGAIMIPLQMTVAAQWPADYSWQFNLISDLGATMCGIADEGTRVERDVCSPWHVLANAATALNGLLLTAGALLLWRALPAGRSARAGLILLTIGGVLVAGVGLTPWDLAPDLHHLFALVQAPVQWVGMLLIAFGTWRSPLPRMLPVLTLIFTAVSLTGFALFIDAIGGGRAAPLGIGLTERIAFDSLTLWSVAAGFVLIVSAKRAASGGALDEGSSPASSAPIMERERS